MEELNEQEINLLLERFDQTETKLQRQIVAGLAAKASKLEQENHELRAKAMVYPETITPALEHILGRPNFICGSMAALMRKTGHKITEKAEAEQAHVIHWLLCLYLKHGDNWPEEADKAAKAMRNQADGDEKLGGGPP